MSNPNTENEKIYVGMDVSQKTFEVFVIQGEKCSQKTLKIANSKESISKFFSKLPVHDCVVILETGTHSHWMSELISSLGAEVIVADARKLRFIWGSENKSDARDAEMLARIGKFDRKLLYQTRPLTREEQEDLLLVKIRGALIKKRTAMVNEIRGWLRSIGEDDCGLTPENMSKEFYQRLSPKLKKMFAPYIKVLAQLHAQIRQYDKLLEKECAKHPETKIMRQVNGVGPITALTFFLLVRDPKRFKDGRQLSAYFGLVPRRDQSGEIDKQLGITKAGNHLMRTTLVQAANYILGHFGEDCDLREFGLRICARGGTIARRKAKVAIARKLCSVLLTLWKNSDISYDPHFIHQKKKQAKIA